MTAWLAAPQELRDEAALVDALLDDLLVLLEPYAVDVISSSEPRLYRLTPRGRALLREALAARRVESLFLQNGVYMPHEGMTATIDLGELRSPVRATQIGVTIRPGPRTSPASVAVQLATFLLRWFGRLRAAAAFVSDNPYDLPTGTRYEYDNRLPSLLIWPGVRRYVRGVFWGMGLGGELCAHLGGQERVLREAPVASARALDDGVWLQLSAEPPAEPAAYDRLAGYLAPLLQWTVARYNALLPERPPARPLTAVPPVASATGRPGQAVPIHIRGGLEQDIALEVYLAEPPTPDQQVIVEAAVEDWFGEGGRHVLSGGACEFDLLSDPSVDTSGAVIRWSVDLGSADEEQAIQALAQRLGALVDPKVTHLVAGMAEEVG